MQGKAAHRVKFMVAVSVGHLLAHYSAEAEENETKICPENE